MTNFVGLAADDPARVPHAGRVPGRARTGTHHGEFLQGVFAHGPDLRRGLVSVPCAMFHTEARFVATADAELTVSPQWKHKARRAARLTLDELGMGDRGGRLAMYGQVPLGRGFGSSTSDVLSAIGAVLDAYGTSWPAKAIARIAVRAETASDGLMFNDNAVLFAHRAGELIEDFGAPPPDLVVVGFGTSDGGLGVDTVALAPASYTDAEVAEFASLRERLRNALRANDVRGIGAVATASAEINQRHLPVPGFARLVSTAEKLGAVGIQVAHSGDIAGLLFDAGDEEADLRVRRAQHLLHAELGVRSWQFRTGPVEV